VVIGALLLLPESVSQWTTAQKHPSAHTWWANVQQPVWDQDTWAVNYLGHPYFGALYYLRARDRGLGVFEAFWYTAVLSTLYEFGAEAFFERPSYQDLLVTPVGGVLLGAVLFEPLRARIQGKPVLRWYDQLALTLTDPLGAANRVVERALGLQAEVRVQVRPLALAPPAPEAARPARTPTRPEDRHLRPPGVSIEVRVAGRRPGPARQGKA
jgi:hypothetical protein